MTDVHRRAEGAAASGSSTASSATFPPHIQAEASDDRHLGLVGCTHLHPTPDTVSDPPRVWLHWARGAASTAGHFPLSFALLRTSEKLLVFVERILNGNILCVNPAKK